MGWDKSFDRAFLKAQLGAGTVLPDTGAVFLSIREADKTEEFAQTARMLESLGLSILATRGTTKFLSDNGVKAQMVNKVYEGGRTIVDMMKDGEVALVMNTTEGTRAIEDSRSLRNVALMDKIPYFTTAAGSHAAALAMVSQQDGDIEVKSLQE